MRSINEVTRIPAGASSEAAAHFEARLEWETDCWDVHEALGGGDPGFVLVDVRGPEAFRAAHIPGAVNIPHRRLTEDTLASYPMETLFVVYCAGPHCNGACRAAARLARLGRPVKEMLGGVTGWQDEGFALA